MADWAPKRFWKQAEPAPTEGGWHVTLDGRLVKTPAKAPLVVPTQPMAEAIALEWDAQSDKINPATMPVTRSANAAIDKVFPQFNEVAHLVAEYGGSDLLCYRAGSPAELVRRQQQAWDPLLDWAAQRFDAPLVVTTGVMPLAQPSEALANLRAEVMALSAFELTAFSDLVALSGSLLIGFAAIHGLHPLDTLWEISRTDEEWQISQWGADEEATELALSKRRDFEHAGRFFALCQ